MRSGLLSQRRYEFLVVTVLPELLTGKSEKQLIGLTPLDVYDEDIAVKVMETDEKSLSP